VFRPPKRARFFTENDYSPLVNKREGLAMNLSPPTTVVFVVSIVLAVLAIIGKFVMIPVFTDNGFWVVVVAYVILACGNIFRGF
jgi:threonine/homoserine/homoserine lactone efflux protein